MAKNWEHAAGVVWDILANAASKNETVSYSQIAPIIQTNPLSVSRALGPIQDYCIDNKLPPLTSIVIGKNSKKPGGGFIAWDVDDLEQGQQLVYSYNWQAYQNPYGSFGLNDTIQGFAQEIVNKPSVSAEIYSRVKVRGIAQKIFREALFDAYDGKCAFCGFSFPSALQAAHILPWSESENDDRLNPKNGLLLCSIHHSLFDSGLITISESYKITYHDPNKEDGPYGKYDEAMTAKLHGKNIRRPKDGLEPDKFYIEKRNIRDEWGKLP